MDPIYVTGHRNPDTDSIVAAIAYASLRNALGDREYEAACLGRVSDETQLVLNLFGFAPPTLISNVYTQVQDLEFDKPPILSAAVTVGRAWKALQERKEMHAIPVSNDDGTLFGMMSREDIASYNMELNNACILDKVPLFNVLSVLEGKVINEAGEYLDTVSGEVVLAIPESRGPSLFSNPNCVVICGNQPDLIRQALERNVNCLVLCRTELDTELKKIDTKTCIISTPCDAYRATRLIFQSTPIGRICRTKDLVCFHLHDKLDDVKEQVLKYRESCYPIFHTLIIIQKTENTRRHPMKRFSEKVYLQLKMPTEEVPLSDEKRIRLALEALGYENVQIPLAVMRRLYPLCRNAGFDITVTLVRRETDWAMVSVEAGDTTKHHYGLAVDYGSTTIVMELVDMNSGAVIDQVKAVNGQAAYGTDILTRITFAMEDPGNPELLQKATVKTFDSLLEQLTENTGIDASRCPVMILSGNTTMIHFLLQLDAWTVFASPYAPVVSDPGFFWGRELGMTFKGLVYIIPAASNYIGGDIVSGLLKLDIHKQEETSLFFDIGTNGELVIGNKDWMMAGAGAAGPALEAYISHFGMRAGEGAIDSVRIQGDQLSFTTIGNQKPVGICGSGIIDLIAQMRLNGWINIAGELNPDASSRIRYLDGEYVAVYALAEESASGEILYFSQTDIMQYLDTKAAAYTMVECLLESAGVSFDDLSNCYLSGAFPAHSDLESAITIGIFPDLPREKYQVLSNTSLEGARILLLDRSRLEEAKNIAENMYCVQFASVPDFLVRMQAAKFIPHTDLSRYPSIQKQLNQT